MPSQGSPLTAAEARPPAWWEELGAVLPRSVASVRRAARGGRTDVPALAANPLAWGSVAVDELAMSAAYLLSRRAAAEVAEPARADAAESVAGLRAAGVIDDPTLAHPAPTDVSAVRRTTRRRVGIDFEHVSFDSGYAPPVPLPGGERWAADNDSAHAYLLRRDTAPRPWVLVLHGHRMGEPRDLRLLGSRRLQSDLDVNVAHLVLPMHGPRGRGSGGGFPGVDPVANFRGMAQAVWDARLLLSWLRGQGATSVGVFGVSLGGHVAAMLAGLEPALDAVVAGVPTCDFATMLADTMRAHWGEAALAASHVGDEDFRSLSRLVSPLAFPPRLPRDRLFVYGAVGDRLITPQQAEALWRHWDRPAILWLQGGHIVNNTGASRRFVVDAFAGCGVAGMRRGRG
jgi:dienelactone hydrolase